MFMYAQVFSYTTVQAIRQAWPVLDQSQGFTPENIMLDHTWSLMKVEAGQGCRCKWVIVRIFMVKRFKACMLPDADRPSVVDITPQSQET